MSERIDDIWEDAIEGWKSRIDDNFAFTRSQINQYCESPIEKLFAAAFCTIEAPIYETHGGLNVRPLPIFCGDYTKKILEVLLKPEQTENGVWVFPQCQIGKYRADFVIIARFETSTLPLTKIIIECDGHDFHERTKDQAQRDKARDRFFVANHYKVMRFTGSELHRNPLKCADEVMSHLDDIAHGEGTQ